MSRKPVVDIFIPCLIDQFFPETAFNTVKILEKVGCNVNYNPNQTCCGATAYQMGYFDEAKEVAVKFLSDFPNQNRYVVSPSSSCVGTVRTNYNQIFNGSAYYLDCKRLQKHIFELSEFLLSVLKVDKVSGAKLEAKAVYHDSCTALRQCNIKESPRKLLTNVNGLQLIELKDAEVCCGFGNDFSYEFESISVAMAQQKVENALAEEADLIISTDISCLMHLQAYINKQKLSIRTMHISDVLASGW